jgi:hypothetical protein
VIETVENEAGQQKNQCETKKKNFKWYDSIAFGSSKLFETNRNRRNDVDSRIISQPCLKRAPMIACDWGCSGAPGLAMVSSGFVGGERLFYRYLSRDIPRPIFDVGNL